MLTPREEAIRQLVVLVAVIAPSLGIAGLGVYLVVFSPSDVAFWFAVHFATVFWSVLQTNLVCHFSSRLARWIARRRTLDVYYE